MNELIIGISTTALGVVGTLTAIWLKYHLEKRKKQEEECPVHCAVADDKEIIARLDEIKEEIGADRVSIFSFHNGGEYYSGKSMQKLTCSYEVVSPGVARQQLAMQNVPVSACHVTLQKLMENKEFHCYDVDQNYPESGCKSYLVDFGVKSTYQYCIFDLNRRAIGLLRADFVLEREELSDEGHAAMKYTAIKLSGYLIGNNKTK